MKVQFIGDSNLTPEMYYEVCGPTRFLAFMTEGEIVINIYWLEWLHIYLLNDTQEESDQEMSFLGGGYCSPNFRKFDSSSCKEVFGFDRPEDPLLQEEILKAIEDFLNNL